MEKSEKIKSIMDRAGAELAAEGVQYFIGAIDTAGQNAFVQSDIKGENFVHILDMAMPTKQDAINLGIYVGQLINARKDKK